MTRIDSGGRVRFCESCERPVYNSAAMTRDELADLIARHEGGRMPCLQLHRRPDGTIVTRDCFAVRVGRFVWLKVGLAAVAFWSWALGVHPLARPFRRDGAPPSSSEEITGFRGQSYISGGLAVIVSPPNKEPASLLSRTAPAQGWSDLPAVDRAPPLRTLEAEEEIWNPGPGHPGGSR